MVTWPRPWKRPQPQLTRQEVRYNFAMRLARGHKQDLKKRDRKRQAK